MFKSLYRHRPTILSVALIVALGMIVAGCSDDENPTGPNDTSEFNEDLAGAQAAVAAPMAISMVENLPLFADGFTAKDFSYSFTWDSEMEAWRAETTFDEEGYAFQFVYYVQYRDAQGNPQPSEVGAVSMWYSEDGVGDFSYEDDRSSLYAHQEFANQATVDGLDTATLTIAGGGGYDFTYEAHSDGNSATLDLSATWETLGNDISVPVGGCPTGTIRYHFAPYSLDVVFDGDDTVTYTLYTADGDPVPGYSGMETLVCGS